MFMLWITTALAGYGDPQLGHPTPDERLVFLWTNAARVEPGAFTADYQSGGCSAT